MIQLNSKQFLVDVGEENLANQVSENRTRDRNNWNDATKKCYLKLLLLA